MLSFDIRELETDAVAVDSDLAADDPIWQADDAMPAGPVHVSGRLSAAGTGRFYWHGRIAGSAVLPCRRCLQETSVEVQDEAHVIFAATDVEEAEEPDVYPFDPRARELDLRPAVRELWLLNAPRFVLCKDDCKGLCPNCGADLNAGPCSCPPVHDARWDALHKRDSSSAT